MITWGKLLVLLFNNILNLMNTPVFKIAILITYYFILFIFPATCPFFNCSFTVVQMFFPRVSLCHPVIII